MAANDPTHFLSSVWYRGFKQSRRLVDTLTIDTLITDECPDHNTPQAQSLVRERGSYIGVHPLWHSPVWDRESSEASGKVVIISQWRRYRRHRGAGSSQSSASILGSRDTAGMEGHHRGQWTKLMTWVKMKGKPNGRPEVSDSSWWFILDIYTKLTNIWEEYCGAVINNTTKY